MKKILAMAAAAALACGVSASAANPFSDVSTSDWAYQAVSDLSDQGIVEGYPDGTFRGQTNITRYEMAQIVARLMAQADQYNAEQRAMIDQLAVEYADELDSLGVRVSNLEKKVGNISWTGDSRMRYKSNPDGSDNWQGRIRLTMKGQVNDSTYVVGRMTTGNVDLKGSGDADVSMDRLYVHHDFGDQVGLTLGRYELDMGQQGTWLYGNAFDGAELQFDFSEDYLLRVGFGRMRDADDESTSDSFHGFNKAETFYAQARADFHSFKLGIDYYRTQNFEIEGERYSDNVYGVNLLVPVQDFRIFGDYYQNTDASGDPTIWAVGVGYGGMNLQKPGSFGIDLAYYDVEEGLYHSGMSGLDINGDMFEQDGSFWLATADVVLMKNLYLHGEYAFAYDRDHSSDSDFDDAWELALIYKF